MIIANLRDSARPKRQKCSSDSEEHKKQLHVFLFLSSPFFPFLLIAKKKKNKTECDSLKMYQIICDNEKTMSAVEFLKEQRAILDAERYAVYRELDSMTKEHWKRIGHKIADYAEQVKSDELDKQ